MESILLSIEDFLAKLPPLLQLLAGVFATLAIMKVIILIADYFDEKKPKN